MHVDEEETKGISGMFIAVLKLLYLNTIEAYLCICYGDSEDEQGGWSPEACASGVKHNGEEQHVGSEEQN